VSPLFPPYHQIVELNEHHQDMLDLINAAYPDSVARRQAEVLTYMAAVTAMDRAIDRVHDLQQQAITRKEINSVLGKAGVQRPPSDDEQP